MKTEDHIVQEVIGWFYSIDMEDRAYFLETPRVGVATTYHNTLGRSIRNEFRLWEQKWEPTIQDGVDCSDNHPDAVSSRIILAVYDALHEAS